MSEVLEFTIRGYSMYPSYTPGNTITFNTMPKGRAFSLQKNDLVVFKHPFKKGIKLFKRIKAISEESIFVTGDNPDPNSSFDSHNFGPINKKNILGYKKERK